MDHMVQQAHLVQRVQLAQLVKLVQLAQLYHLPVYSLCAANKFLPAAAAPLLPIVAHPSEEVWPGAPTTVQVHNHYFDTTPLTLFTGIISDLALYTPTTLALELQRLTLAPALQQLASHWALGTPQDTSSIGWHDIE